MLIVLSSPLFAERHTPLTWTEKLTVRHWLQKENHAAVKPGHLSTVHLIEDRWRRPVKTKYSVLIISGLFQSPITMQGLAKHFAEQKFNVINMRLAGHYEQDDTVLSSSIQWTDWKHQAREAFSLAQELGEKVIVVGHSTGGLLLTWLTLEEPEKVGGIALFSPAFAINPVSLASAWASKAFSLNYRFKDRFVAGHAGLEVDKMAQEFQNLLSSDPEAAERLKHIPIWMANTAVDMIIDVPASERVIRQLTLETAAPRVHFEISSCELVLHDRIVSPEHTAWKPMIESLSSVLPPHRN